VNNIEHQNQPYKGRTKLSLESSGIGGDAIDRTPDAVTPMSYGLHLFIRYHDGGMVAVLVDCAMCVH
jgi:hypothetical protein